MYGAIEAGGTKFVCSIGNSNLEILEQISIPTDSPASTMSTVIEFFEKYRENLSAIGIGSFGPIDINKNSDTYGYITQTPKLKWRHFDFVGTIENTFKEIEIAWTTDVNAAAYGEYSAKKGIQSLVYYTIGTGIGGGSIQNGEFIQGHSHPEMGHTVVRKHEDDNFKGICPSHGDCLEGLASGPAIESRLGTSSKNVPPSDPYWEMQAYYIAQSAFNASLYIAPDVIVYGGGVMKVNGLIDKVHEQFKRINQEYIDTPRLEKYIIKPNLKDDSATIGCLRMAKEVEKSQL